MPTNKIILLIEDNPLLTGMYKTAFENAGFEVLLAHDGETGLGLMKDHKPNGVVLDLLMPGTDGFEVLKRAKSDKETSDTKIVVLTSVTKEEDLARAKELGALDCLVKSELTLADIVKRVGEYIK